jgi:ferredoxin
MSRTTTARVPVQLTTRAEAERGPDDDGVERVRVDWTRCDGRGVCTELLGELLVEDDWGYPVSTTGEVAPTVPRSLRRAARLAAAECPRMALSLRSSTAGARQRG